MGEYEYVPLFLLSILSPHQTLIDIVHLRSIDAEWICPRCGYFNPSPKSRRPSAIPDTAIPSTPTTTSTAIAPTSSTDGEGRQRKGKKSSGLKHELERDAADKSSDRMDVDEDPSEEQDVDSDGETGVLKDGT